MGTEIGAAMGGAMEWTVAAWVVVVLHLGFLLFQMLGALLALVSRGWLVAHLATVVWGIGIVVVQGSCPLTVLEKDLIDRAGDTPYAGSFLDHYLFGILIPDGTQALVYGTHLVVILATYAYVVPKLRQRAKQRPGRRPRRQPRRHSWQHPWRRDADHGAPPADAELTGSGFD